MLQIFNLLQRGDSTKDNTQMQLKFKLANSYGIGSSVQENYRKEWQSVAV